MFLIFEQLVVPPPPLKQSTKNITSSARRTISFQLNGSFFVNPEKAKVKSPRLANAEPEMAKKPCPPDPDGVAGHAHRPLLSPLTLSAYSFQKNWRHWRYKQENYPPRCTHQHHVFENVACQFLKIGCRYRANGKIYVNVLLCVPGKPNNVLSLLFCRNLLLRKVEKELVLKTTVERCILEGSLYFASGGWA